MASDLHLRGPRWYDISFVDLMPFEIRRMEVVSGVNIVGVMQLYIFIVYDYDTSHDKS